MKRASYILLIVVLCLAVVLPLGCTSSPATPTTAPAPATTSAAAPAASSPSGAAVKEIKVGVVLPFSGPSGTIGDGIQKSENIALDDINITKGGIKSMGGAKLTFIWRDHAGNPDTAAAEVEKLITVDKVDMLITGHLVQWIMPMAAVAEKYKVPNLIISGGVSQILEQGWKYSFMPLPVGPPQWYLQPAVDTTKWLSDKAADKDKSKTWAFITETGDNGALMLKAYPDMLAKAGFTSVMQETVPADISEFGPLASKLKASNADVYFVHLAGAHGVAFLRAMAEQGAKPKVLWMPNSGSVAGFREDNLSHCVMVTSPTLALDNEYTRLLTSSFKTRYGRDIESFAVTYFSWPYLVADVYERAGTTDKAKVRDAFAATDVSGGPFETLSFKRIKFDERGGNTVNGGGTRQILDHKEVNLWPAEFRAGEPVYPGQWKW